MQKCEYCGKDVKYVAIKMNQSVVVDAEEKTFYTITGREVKGFEKHICKEEDKKND